MVAGTDDEQVLLVHCALLADLTTDNKQRNNYNKCVCWVWGSKGLCLYEVFVFVVWCDMVCAVWYDVWYGLVYCVVRCGAVYRVEGRKNQTASRLRTATFGRHASSE